MEKPGALYLSELESLHELSANKNAKVFIAYNRRLYSSVFKLRKSVESDGITSAVFEFTEWSHKIRLLKKAPGVKERLLLVNSTHVIDLVFDLIGLPAEGKWHGWHVGSLDWHPASARFHGAGLSELGIPFSYHADWESAGRWAVEISTRKNKYILRPLESLQVVPLGSVESRSVELCNQLDLKFKPGLFLQCESFLNERHLNCVL